MVAKAGTGPKCPICGKPAVPEHKPFCSARCKQVDLNRWLTESYRVPDRPLDDEAERPDMDAEDDR